MTKVLRPKKGERQNPNHFSIQPNSNITQDPTEQTQTKRTT